MIPLDVVSSGLDVVSNGLSMIIFSEGLKMDTTSSGNELELNAMAFLRSLSLKCNEQSSFSDCELFSFVWGLLKQGDSTCVHSNIDF